MKFRREHLPRRQRLVQIKCVTPCVRAAPIGSSRVNACYVHCVIVMTRKRPACSSELPGFPGNFKVDSADTFKHPIYAGTAIATVQSADPIKVVTVRTTGFDAAAATGGSAAVENAEGVADSGNSFVGREDTKSDRPELTGSQDHRLGRPGARLRRKVQRSDDASRRQALSRPRRYPRSRGRGLCPQTTGKWADRQDRRPTAVHRSRHLWRHPAARGHEGPKVIVAINKDEEARSSRWLTTASWPTSSRPRRNSSWRFDARISERRLRCASTCAN
ncbi:Electron transfer flavoprotein domain-containing protein [Variovorax sp. HW608]|nr:Electron transfer flavoprotein domain-containing protein [Variovorax sp. HW608]